MIMHDVIETLNSGSVIQHGKHNDRIYLMKLNGDARNVVDNLQELAKQNNYSKIFCKVPSEVAPAFFSDGFILEGVIPGFYNKKQDVFFLSKFLNSDRLLNIEQNRLLELSNTLINKYNLKKPDKRSQSDIKFRRLSASDVGKITSIYSEVFASYPFPIHNPDYIKEAMSSHVQFFGAIQNGEIMALASCEIDFQGLNAELTDFATPPLNRGKNLSAFLLKKMEKEMKKQGIATLYTIARLNSIPMNRTFLKYNYSYSGTLIKNTNIAGQIESMNVYYKKV